MSLSELEEMQAHLRDMETRLRRHDDMRAIDDVIGRYCRALDRNDAAPLATVFHDDAEVDYGFFRGGIREFLPIIMGAARMRDRTWHCAVQNEYHFVDSHNANVNSYLLASAFDPLALETAGSPVGVLHHGHYFDRFVFRDDRWAIQHRTFRVAGVIQIQEIALEGQLASLNRMPSMFAPAQ